MDEKESSQTQSEVLRASAMDSIRRQLRESLWNQLAQELFEEEELLCSHHPLQSPDPESTERVNTATSSKQRRADVTGTD
jgi:hypothetical protein